MKFLSYLLQQAKEEGVQKVVVAGMIQNEDGKILILKRQPDDFMGGLEELPSGNIEPGEGIYESLIREIKEETNLDLTRIDQYINFFDYQSKSGKKVRQFNFKVTVTSFAPIILTEHDGYQWLQDSEIMELSNISREVKESIQIMKFNETGQS